MDAAKSRFGDVQILILMVQVFRHSISIVQEGFSDFDFWKMNAKIFQIDGNKRRLRILNFFFTIATFCEKKISVPVVQVFQPEMVEEIIQGRESGRTSPERIAVPFRTIVPQVPKVWDKLFVKCRLGFRQAKGNLRPRRFLRLRHRCRGTAGKNQQNRQRHRQKSNLALSPKFVCFFFNIIETFLFCCHTKVPFLVTRHNYESLQYFSERSNSCPDISFKNKTTKDFRYLL